MPTPARVLRERNHPGWDDIIGDAASRPGQEHVLYGCADQLRAGQVRNKLKTAGRHHGMSVKAFWCASDGSCSHPEHTRCGHDGCAYHVYFTVYSRDAALAYKQNGAMPPAQPPGAAPG